MAQRIIVELEMNPTKTAVILDTLAKSVDYSNFEIIASKLDERTSRMLLKFGAQVDVDAMCELIVAQVGDHCHVN